MRCAICDATLGEDSIQWNNQHHDWDPCPTCLIAISELFNDDSEEEITEQINLEWGEDDPVFSLEPGATEGLIP